MAGAGNALRREHLVAASLVGTVVIVVGFASGLGISRPATVTTTAPSQQAAGGPQPGAAGSGSGAAGYGGGSGGGGSYGGGTNYVGSATPGTGGAGSGTQPIPTGTATPTTTVPVPTTGGGAPGGTCQAGAVSTVVNGAVGAVSGLAGNVPAVSPLLGVLGTPANPTTAPVTVPDGTGLAGLLNTLLGNCTTQTTPPPVTVTTTPGGGS